MSEKEIIPSQTVENKPHQWTAGSLGEVFDKIHIISMIEQRAIPHSNHRTGPLWFRGHADTSYCLTPGTHRKYATALPGNHTPPYLQSNLRESMRRQHFQARTSHLLDGPPGNNINWQEIEQHHASRTRYLDWSESAVVSLKFALMDFLDIRMSQYHDKVPCLWILNPRRLNCKLYNYFVDSTSKGSLDLIRRAVAEFPGLGNGASLPSQIRDHLQNSEWYLSPYAETAGNYYYPESDYELDGIPCLSVLDEMRTATYDSLPNLLLSGAFNPYHYLLLRYYADALTHFISYAEKDAIMPPLAVIQPYHSSRIRVQRGVFTIFPNYISRDPLKKDELLTYTSMERQKLCQDSLYCIRLTNPYRIAQELLASGEQISGLYPEIVQYSSQMER